MPRTGALDGATLRGEIVRLDRFGNVITNLDRKTCEKLGGAVEITVGGQVLTRMVATYADIGRGELAALYGSTDHLEFAAQAASAAERLGVQVGDAVVVTSRA